MKTYSFFKYCILPISIFCCLIIVPINTINAQFAVPVTTGWNMIGSLCEGAQSVIISTLPPGILVSDFFAYQGGYTQTDELKKGVGYWVKVSAPGLIVFNCSGAWACGDPIYDYYELKQYNTVQIGNQCWLKENMNTGIRIDGNQPQTDNPAIEKYCYEDDPVNCNIYGALYQWGEAMQYTTTEGSRGICPPGSHVPTAAEFQTLITAVGDDGNALKALGQGTGDGAGTNTSGFSALLAGGCFSNSVYGHLLIQGYFWTSNGNYSDAELMWLNYDNSEIHTGTYTSSTGYSIRCIKD
jgi:uncharacterized protein (TIGR02145 family)